MEKLQGLLLPHFAVKLYSALKTTLSNSYYTNSILLRNMNRRVQHDRFAVRQ